EEIRLIVARLRQQQLRASACEPVLSSVRPCARSLRMERGHSGPAYLRETSRVPRVSFFPSAPSSDGATASVCDSLNLSVRGSRATRRRESSLGPLVPPLAKK